MVEVGRHPNIEVLTYTEVDSVEGEAGNFKVTLTKKPRYIIEDKCTGCTTCVEYCPVKYPDQFNQEISQNKAVHIYFAQAIPLVAYIDESCLYLKEKKCRICEGVCKNDAIDFNQTPEKVEINVGAVVLSPGLEPFDPKVRAEYRYGEFAERRHQSWTTNGSYAPPGLTKARYCAPPTGSIRRRSPGFSASVPGRSSRAATAIVRPFAAPIPRNR